MLGGAQRGETFLNSLGQRVKRVFSQRKKFDQKLRKKSALEQKRENGNTEYINSYFISFGLLIFGLDARGIFRRVGGL